MSNGWEWWEKRWKRTSSYVAMDKSSFDLGVELLCARLSVSLLEQVYDKNTGSMHVNGGQMASE